jgi:hypothetical protein
MDAASLLDDAGEIVEALADLGVEPVLVGGMALVTLGSRRVTGDFDFVVAHPGERLQELVDVFYDRGLELASRVNADGEVTATIDNPRVASARLRIDAPASAHFVHHASGLRIDLLFDFPEPAHALAANARTLKVRSHRFRVASEADLLRLKRVARARRSLPGDVEDIAFLEARRKRNGPSRD